MNEPDPYEDDNHKAPPKLQIKDIKVDVKVYETEKTEGAEEDSPKGDNPRVYSGIADPEKDLSSKQLPANFTDGGSSKSKPKQKFNQASTAANGPSHEVGAETQTKGDQSSLFVIDKTIDDKPRHALLIALLCFKEHPVFSRTLLLVKLIDLPLFLSVQGQIPLSTLVVSLINFCATLGLYALIRRQITLESRWILFQILLLCSFSVCLMVVCYQVLVRIAEVELPLLKVPFLLLSLVQTMIWLGQNSLIYYIAGRAAQREAQSRNGPAYNQRHDESSIDNHSAIMGKSSIPIEGMVPISKASAPINLVPTLVPSVQTSSQFNTDTTEIQGTKGQNLVSNDSAESTERQARKVKRRTKAPERLEPVAQDSPPVQAEVPGSSSTDPEGQQSGQSPSN